MSKRRRKVRLVPIDLDVFTKKTKLRVRPKFVLVAFGDTIKFREWEDLYLVSSWESWKFIERLYGEFIRIRNGSVFVKPLADGFMAVKELSKDPLAQADQVIEFLRRCCKVVNAINKFIKEGPEPRLKGFRIRVAIGFVGRLEMVRLIRAMERQVDYTGKPNSIAFSLLPVEPRIPCICVGNVKAVADRNPDKNKRLAYRLLKNPKDFSGRVSRKVLRFIYAFSETDVSTSSGTRKNR